MGVVGLEEDVVLADQIQEIGPFELLQHLFAEALQHQQVAPCLEGFCIALDGADERTAHLIPVAQAENDYSPARLSDIGEVLLELGNPGEKEAADRIEQAIRSVLDAGAGAGLPGIPLAIVKPDLDVTLVDSAGKKVRFMNHVGRALGLSNVRPVQSRVETLEAEAPFGTIVSRAFSGLSAFLSSVRHLAGGHTRLLAMKGRRPDEEIGQLPEWAAVRSVEKLTVPGLHEDRHLVIMSVNP